MNRTILAGLLVVFIGALAVFADDKTAKEMQGTWTVVSGQENGKALPAEQVKDTRVVITEDTITVQEPNNKKRVMKYKLDPAKKTIDMTETEGSEKGKTALGIYALEGDTLKLCYGLPGRDRPKDFNTKADSGDLSFLLKKAKN